jgi:predicted small lipoprotein YifL
MKNLWKYMPMLAMMVAVSFMAGCGVKPKDLDPPQGSKNTAFPKTYPAQNSR